MQPSEEIKSKLDIVDVLRGYIQLKAAGTSFRALCPFHHEKSPSFMVSPEKQIWHCFGCGKGGDIFSFVMEMEGIGFPEALRQLAQKAGVKLQSHDPKMASQRNRLLDIAELSGKYYHKMLLDMKQAEAAREYLSGRGLSDDTIDEWNIGYSSESWDDLLVFLKAKGFKEDEIFRAGMSVKREKMSGFYNRFRGRVMFPIRDINGSTVGFSARVLPAEDDGPPAGSGNFKMGKYINSPQSAIYDKSRIIFGLDKAKRAIKEQDLAIIVEGQMDVITAHQHGFKNVVASSGTALTPEQVNLLKRYSQNIALAFDMDKAGEMAAERGIKVASEMDMNIKVIEVPNGKDPDECIKNSREEWQAAVAGAKQMMDYHLDKVLSGIDRNDIDRLDKAGKKLLAIIADIGSKIKQDHWLKILAEKIDKPEPSLREMMKAMAMDRKKSEMASGRPKEKEPEAKQDIPKTREEKLSEVLIALALKFPELSGFIANRTHQDHVAGEMNRSLYRNLVIYYNNIVNGRNNDGEGSEMAMNYGNFRQWMEENIEGEGRDNIHLKTLEMLAMLGDRDFFNYDIEQAKAEALNVILVLKRNHLLARMRETEKLIAEAERAGENMAVMELMKDFKLLADELNDLQK